jgi:hypothetical protein
VSTHSRATKDLCDLTEISVEDGRSFAFAQDDITAVDTGSANHFRT